VVAVSEVLHLVALAEEGVFEVDGDIFYVDAWVMVESVCHVFFSFDKVYAFLNVQVTLPKESLSPSLTGVALSGSRRLPLMRVELVLFRSVTV